MCGQIITCTQWQCKCKNGEPLHIKSLSVGKGHSSVIELFLDLLFLPRHFILLEGEGFCCCAIVRTWGIQLPGVAAQEPHRSTQKASLPPYSPQMATAPKLWVPKDSNWGTSPVGWRAAYSAASSFGRNPHQRTKPPDEQCSQLGPPVDLILNKECGGGNVRYKRETFMPGAGGTYVMAESEVNYSC